MNEEMKAKLAKYMQDNGYYDTMAIRRDEGYSNRAASWFAIFGDDGEGREEERSELLAAADAYNEAKMAAEKAAQPAKPQTKTEIVHAPFADLGQDSIIEVPVSESTQQPQTFTIYTGEEFEVEGIRFFVRETQRGDVYLLIPGGYSRDYEGQYWETGEDYNIRRLFESDELGPDDYGKFEVTITADDLAAARAYRAEYLEFIPEED